MPLSLVLTLLLSAAGSPSAQAAPTADESVPPQQGLAFESVDPRTRARVDLYTKLFYEGKLDELFLHFSPGMRELLPRAGLGQLRKHVLESYGVETTVLGHEAAQRGEFRAFVRWARFDKHEGIMEVQWRLRPDDSVAGFLIRPAQKPSDAAAP